jgi:hypothetical protein
MLVKKLVVVTYAVSVSLFGEVFTPKALHPRAQGRAAAKPQSAPWVTHPITRAYAEGVTQMTNHVPVV